ncbi:unnamed protein product [Protopolystoma xenopodis]|uniref:Uncharacterized protein n=1 Tax=Protopolystoma xenopodis TaxID=117903 RepID=A0A448X1C5_9PLAT|nr:unnamed protein product [Protopolystoma xenopodis]
MLPRSDAVRHWTDGGLAPFHRNRRRLHLGASVIRNLPVKLIDSWSRGMGRRLLVEWTIESLRPKLPINDYISSI